MPPKPKLTAKQAMEAFDQHTKTAAPTRTRDGRVSRLSSCGKCLQWSMLGLNFIFLVLGIVLIALGAYALNSSVLGLTSGSLPKATIGLGVFVLLFAILGGCGAKHESGALLVIYAVLLIVLVLVQIIVAALIFTDEGRADRLIRNAWEDVDDPSRNDVQARFLCCGFNGPTDLPGTVCPTEEPGASTGCLQPLKDEFKKNIVVLGAIGLTIALLELFAIAFACLLRRASYNSRFSTDVVLEEVGRRATSAKH